MREAADIIDRLGMIPHPEGGHFVETWRDPREIEGRAASSAIYYLLREGERSHWHRIDAAEVWHFHAGSALELGLSADGVEARRLVLGSDLIAGERPQLIVPAGVWQSARSLGVWTLVGCTVAPGFLYETFEMAPREWSPGKGQP